MKKFYLSIVMIIGFYQGVHAQSDTLFVYDTIYVYDTIPVNVTEQEITSAILELDTVTLNSRLITFFDHQTATIPIKRIYINENLKNSSDMKKISSFSLMFMLLSQAVLSQVEYGAKIGSTFHVERNDRSDLGLSVTSGFQAGLSATMDLGSKLDLRLEPSYALIGNDFHQLLIPAKVFWGKGKFKPSVGIHFNNGWSGAWRGHLGPIVGGLYKLNDKTAVQLEYLRNLFNMSRYYGGSFNNNSSQINLSISYRLSRFRAM